MVSDEHDEMHGDVHDETIERIAAHLRPFPEVDPAARARLLVAVAAERERDRERHREGRARPRVVRWSVAAAVALAAAIALAVVLPRADSAGPEAARTTAGAGGANAESATAPAPNAALAATDAAAAALRPVQLVFRAPSASRVSVVGDFSGWDPSQAVMTRDAGSGLWTVTLRLTPGRHVYAFLVDDSIWVRDPRAPAAPDADFGRPGSVMLVGQP